MRIGIDARFYGLENKGLGRYTQKLIEYLEKIDKNDDIQYYIFLTSSGNKKYQPRNSKKFKKIEVNFSWYNWKEQFIFPFILRKYKLDLVHFCHFNVPLFYRGKFVVTIHDLILFYFPTIRGTTLNKHYYKFKLFIYRKIIASAIEKSEKIIAVSDFTKKDILKNFKIKSNKIEIIKEGFLVSNQVIEGDKGVGGYAENFQPYLLYVGSAYPHKNLEKLCLAFKEIRREKRNLKLILIGRKDYFYNRLREFIQKNDICGIIILENVNDARLRAIYKRADLFVFPSLHEGFGLPPLEALYFKTPVLSSNCTAMPEVLGDAVSYFNPHQVISIRRAILKELKTNNARCLLDKNSERQLRRYSWKKMANKILEIYKEYK